MDFGHSSALTVFVLAIFVGFRDHHEGAPHAAHAADVRRKRDFRHHNCRSPRQFGRQAR